MWNAWTAPPGARHSDYDPWACEAHCARCGELAQDCHCDEDDMTRASSAMTNERRAELLRAMEGHDDEQAVLFIVGWGAPELTCGEVRELLTSRVDHPDAAHEIVCLECVDSQPIIDEDTEHDPDHRTR